MFKSEVSNMVPCYGISKDEEGNYTMVMKFMKEGNLRTYLEKNYGKLDFYSKDGKNSKFHLLKQIIQGLKDIHRKGLVHKDFHSRNIIIDIDEYNNDIICRITDLGLCKPVNEESEKGKVY